MFYLQLLLELWVIQGILYVNRLMQLISF